MEKLKPTTKEIVDIDDEIKKKTCGVENRVRTGD